MKVIDAVLGYYLYHGISPELCLGLCAGAIIYFMASIIVIRKVLNNKNLDELLLAPILLLIAIITMLITSLSFGTLYSSIIMMAFIPFVIFAIVYFVLKYLLVIRG